MSLGKDERPNLPWRSKDLRQLQHWFGGHSTGQLATRKIAPLSHLNGFHMFPRDNIPKTFTVMHYPVFED